MSFEDAPTQPFAPAREPAWVAYARTKLGTHEIAGPEAHPFIIECLRDVGIRGSLLSDETAWCSAFANRCMKAAGIRGTGSALARSWEHWGVALDKPRSGCIAIFSRPPDPNHGHVGFLAGIGPGGETLQILGGNEDNAVRVLGYPRVRLIGYRWPSPEMLQSAGMS